VEKFSGRYVLIVQVRKYDYSGRIPSIGVLVS
jgi:hypothetical protein